MVNMHEGFIRNLEFATIMRPDEARVRGRVAKKINGVTFTSTAIDKWGWVEGATAAESEEALAKYAKLTRRVLNKLRS